MYHILPESHEDIIGIRFQGWVGVKDYKTLFPYLEGVIHEQRSIRLLSDLTEYKGMNLGAVFKIVTFLFKYKSFIEKKAVITDDPILYKWTKLMMFFSKAQVRCFQSFELEEAWEWIRK